MFALYPVATHIPLLNSHVGSIQELTPLDSVRRDTKQWSSALCILRVLILFGKNTDIMTFKENELFTCFPVFL